MTILKYNIMTLQTQAPPSKQHKKLKEITSMNTDPIEEAGFGVSEVWDAKDYDKLLDIMYDIRKGKKELVTQLVNDAVDIFHGVVPKDPLRTVQPKIASIDHNVITHPGIALTNKNITGEDMTRFLYIMSGTGNSETPTIHSDHVEDENARVSILDTGFYFASGTALFQGAVFPTNIDDAVVKSFGSATHNDPNEFGYTVFWVNRLLDSSKFVYHLKNKTVYSHLHVIDRRSRLSE
jgi:hypothetical protein